MFFASTLLIAALSAAGCGGGQLGPAKPEDTPVVNQEDVREKVMNSMPPDMRAKYESKMKPGGS
jgi:hypothetical protein